MAQSAARCGAAPLLIHGKRRIKEGMVDEFKHLYEAYSRAAMTAPGVKACFAFASAEPLAFWHVMWAKDVASWESAQAKGTEASPGLLSTYGSTREDPDTLHVYGGWDEAMKRADPSVDLCFHKSMAGYMKQDGAGEPGPPLIGFTRRHVLPGRADALAASFETVCDYWHERVPGILAAEVSQDGSVPNMVHDIRIFANHAAFQAHADKTDPAFVAVMTAWFANYDTSVPFTGELYPARHGR
jgi:hypothetical protein